MATKKEGTPDGIICSCCGQDKPPYQYYSRLGKTFHVTRYFFMRDKVAADVCWSCNGDYRCLGCGDVKPASQFRIGGRFCQSCKDSGIHKVTADAYTRIDTSTGGDSLEGENALESGGNA